MVKKITLILMLALASPCLVFAYDQQTTHPLLTQEIIRFFNQHYPQDFLNTDDAELIIQGSIHEDDGIRWMRHFYDPINNRGLVLEKKEFIANPNLAMIANPALTSEWASAKDWGSGTDMQNGFLKSIETGTIQNYFSGSDDYSWDRAIYEYGWGDKKRGLATLGHILHLLEDMAVPDHTRNDPHPAELGDASPYEQWTKRFTRSNTSITPQLIQEKPTVLPNLNSYFDEIARYSNNNFFSKDTIFDENYNNPIITKESIESINGISYRFGYASDNNGTFYRLIKIKTAFNGDTPKYSIGGKNDDLILSDYWSHLSRHAVLSGAGVVKLFFDEVEREKQTRILYEKNRAWLIKVREKAEEFIKKTARATQEFGRTAAEWAIDRFNSFTDTLSHPLLKVLNFFSEPKDQSQGALFASIAGAGQTAETENQQQADTGISSSEDTNTEPQNNINTSALVPAQASLQTSNPQNTNQNTIPLLQAVIHADPPEDHTATNTQPQTQTAEKIVNPVFSSSPIIGSGGPPTPVPILVPTPPASSQTADDESSASSSSRAVATSSSDTASSSPAVSGAAATPDTTAPDISFAISECAQSFSPDGCVIATTTLTLIPSSQAGDLGYYAFACEQNNLPCAWFHLATTSATSTSIILPHDNAEYIFRVRAYDKNGNGSDQIQQSLDMIMRPVVINEVAWGGTSAARSEDEWIELYNNTDYALSLENWILRSATDHTPSIQLSGTILSKEFFVLERTDDTTISDRQANQIYTGALGNSGEVLELLYAPAEGRASTTIDKTPPVCSGQWCAGSAGPNYHTMERYDPLADGTRKENWGSWRGFAAYGKNASGGRINGTPGKRNSLHHLIEPGTATHIPVSRTLKKSGSPYVIPFNFYIDAGATLTIEPGVVIKFLPDASFQISGILQSKGATEDPVVFTSLADDEYGGDTNNDGAMTKAKAGDWRGIQVTENGTALDHTVIRYGGTVFAPTPSLGNLQAKNVSLTITHTIIEHSAGDGLSLSQVSGEVSSSVMRNNASRGIAVSGGSLTIRANAFTHNHTGIEAGNTFTSDTPTIVIADNSFEKNHAPVVFYGGFVSFSGNRAVENDTNGIIVPGALLRGMTLAPDLPYVLLNDTGKHIPVGDMLTILPGAVLKFADDALLIAAGTLNARGTAENPVVFTSLHDDDCGIAGGCGDTDSAGSGTKVLPQPGDWRGILFESTSASSTFAHAIIRYGGNTNKFVSGRGAVIIQNTALAITDAVIEKNYYAGVVMTQSASSTIRDSIIRDHQDSFGGSIAYGISLSGNSTATIQNTRFTNNKQNINTDSGSRWIDAGGNVFE